VKQKCQIGEVGRWRGSGSDQPPDLIDPAHHALIKHVVVTHGIVNPLCPLNQPGQDFIEIIDWESVVDTEIRHRSLRANSITIPQLHLRVPLATEQHDLTLSPPGYQHEYGVWLFKAG
jgi:hypothetical protein